MAKSRMKCRNNHKMKVHTQSHKLSLSDCESKANLEQSPEEKQRNA